MESKDVLSLIDIGNLLLQWGMVPVLAIGAIVSMANLRISPRVRWLVVGFTVLFTSTLLSALMDVELRVMASSMNIHPFIYFQGTYLIFHIGSLLGWILIIVGLGAVFGDLRRR